MKIHDNHIFLPETAFSFVLSSYPANPERSSPVLVMVNANERILKIKFIIVQVVQNIQPEKELDSQLI